MSQENKDKAEAAEVRTQQTRGFIQQVRIATRRTIVHNCIYQKDFLGSITIH